MYEIVTRNKRVERKLYSYINRFRDISNKLKRLKRNPRKYCSAHMLYGRLKSKWACWLGSNIRMIYKIDDRDKIIIVEEVGTHKVY